MSGCRPAVLAALTVASLFACGSQALGNHVQCGDVITQDTTLDSDLIDCAGDGLVIGADGITLDLDGHVVDGDGGELCCDAGVTNAPSLLALSSGRTRDGVMIRNGLIREFAYGVSLGLNRSVLRRLTASANRVAGIGSYGSETTIEDNVASGNGYGIHLDGNKNTRVSQNLSVGNDSDGIHMSSSEGNQLMRNTVMGNGGDGIDVSDGVSLNRIERNLVTHNGHTGIWLYEGAHRNRIEKNRVSGNGFEQDSFGGGIVISSGEGNTLARNQASGNGGAGGIVLNESSSENLIERNVASANRQGIVLTEGTGNLVEGNRVFRNSADGITGGDEALIVQNIVSLNGQDGIGAFTGGRVEGNVVSGNGSMGVSPGGTQSVIARNVIFGNGHGVWLDEPTVRENTIMRNSIWGNAGEGVYVLEHADQNEVEANLVFRNGSAGILVGDAGDSRIEGNRVWQNRVGILGHDAYGLKISGNSVTANALDGILVEPFGTEDPIGGRHLVSDNIARRNGDDGIDVEYPDTTLSGNRAYLNADLAIEAVPGVTDGGDNRAFGNGNPLQCVNILCR